MPRTITITIPDELERFASIDIDPIDQVHLRPQPASQPHCAMVAKLARKYGYNFHVCIQLIRSGLHKKDRVILLSMLCASNRRFFRDVARLVLGEAAERLFIDSDELMAYTDLDDGASEPEDEELYIREIKPRDVQIEMLKQELIKETAAKEHYKGLYERQCAKTEEKVETIKERDSLMADKEKLLERVVLEVTEKMAEIASRVGAATGGSGGGKEEEEDDAPFDEFCLDDEKETPKQKKARQKQNHEENNEAMLMFLYESMEPYFDDKKVCLEYCNCVHNALNEKEILEVHTLRMLQKGHLTGEKITRSSFADDLRAIMKPKGRPSPSTLRDHLKALAKNWKNM